MNSVLELAATDGRWLRSVRTRSAIIDAWLELLEEGDLSPTAKGVADRAAIGLRTVFQHFSDMNALHIAASEELMSRITPTVVHVPVERSIEERIALAVTSRGELFESITGLRRAGERQEWTSDAIAHLISEWEAVGTESALRIFEHEFASARTDVRRHLELAVDAALSWSTWNQLRHRRNLTIDDSQAVIRHTLTALFGAG